MRPYLELPRELWIENFGGSYDVVPYRDKTKAVRLQIVDAAAYAQLVLENQGRTLSVQDAAVELGRLRAIPLPPRAGEEPRV